MEDETIIMLYWNRKEAAIRETKNKYGKYCRTIAQNILHNKEDAEECENDTYLDVWEKIPPSKPTYFSAFLGAITRRISIDRWRRHSAEKRNMKTIPLEELEDCIPGEKSIDDAIEASVLADMLSLFLRSLPETEASVFLCRYWFCDSIGTISRRFGFGESKTKMMLKRTREKLLIQLEKEGFLI